MLFGLSTARYFPSPRAKASFSLITPSAQKKESGRGDIHLAVRELTDPLARLSDMDKLGVDIAGDLSDIVSGLFDRRCKIGNRAMPRLQPLYRRSLRQGAPIGSSGSPSRLCATSDAACGEIEWAKEHGAVGVFFRGMEGNLTLDNPYFSPVYALAEKLDLTICIHTGSGSRYLMQPFDVERNHTFAHNRVLPVVAFRDLVANRIPEQFPKLRFGFIEAAASWVPYIFHVLRRSVRSDLKNKNPQDLFRDYRFWVACEADEELPHLLNYIGEDHIVIGSDYGHNDPSKEPEFVKNLRAREDVSPHVVEKILCENAQPALRASRSRPFRPSGGSRNPDI